MENQPTTGEEQVQEPVQQVAEQTTETPTEQQPEAETPQQAPVEFTPEPFKVPVAESTKQDPYESLSPDVVAERIRDNKQALLKALGYDDFAVGALDYYSKTGDLAAYWEQSQ